MGFLTLTVEGNQTCSWLMDTEPDRVLQTAGRDGDMEEPQEITLFTEVRNHFLRLCLHLKETDFRLLAKTVAFHTLAENILDFYKIILSKWIYLSTQIWNTCILPVLIITRHMVKQHFRLRQFWEFLYLWFLLDTGIFLMDTCQGASSSRNVAHSSSAPSSDPLLPYWHKTHSRWQKSCLHLAHG